MKKDVKPVSKANLIIILIFIALFLATFTLFQLVFFASYKYLNILKDNVAVYIFVVLTWLGFIGGSFTAKTFFCSVKSLRLRGIIIVALLVPMEIYSGYLNWIIFFT